MENTTKPINTAMNNELLKAIKNNDDSTLTSLLRYNSLETIKEQIIDLLSLQRQECAEEAMIKLSDKIHSQETYLCKDDDGNEFLISTDKQSIINAKII